MKALPVIVVSLLLSLIPRGGYACNCIQIHSFCEAAVTYKQSGTDNVLLVRGKKAGEIPINQYRTDMIFSIEESFVNRLGLKTIRLVSGNQANCGRTLDEYKQGDELIILAHIWQDAESGENMSQLSICIPNPLEVRGNEVHGDISPGIKSISLSRFRELTTCGNSTYAFRLENHPESSEITLHMLEGPMSTSTLSIYDYLGRLIYQEGFGFQSGTAKEIPTSIFPPGVYFFALSTGGERNIVRFSII